MCINNNGGNFFDDFLVYKKKADEERKQSDIIIDDMVREMLEVGDGSIEGVFKELGEEDKHMDNNLQDPLEKTDIGLDIEFSGEKGDYNFITEKKGIKFFQSEEEGLSIIDVDLELLM